MASTIARASRRLVSFGAIPLAARGIRGTLLNRANAFQPAAPVEVLFRARCLTAGDGQAARLTTSSAPAKAAAAQALEADQAQEVDQVLEDQPADLGFEHTPVPQSFSSLFGEDEEDEESAVVDESLLVENCGLSEVTVSALRGRGIKAMFPIQKLVFDPAMEGRDLLARARTGSGKTLAFALPVAEKVMEARRASPPRPGRAPLCLVLAPTRELATQVEREFASVAPALATACVYGGAPADAQRRRLRAGVDVVVGTPGRVLDLAEQGALDLSKVAYAVLDEADQMLAIGFAEDTERILVQTPSERQTMLFSATTPAWIKRLAATQLRNPVTVDLVGQGATGRLAESITAHAVLLHRADSRRAVLADLLTVYGGGGKSIVFTPTKRDADEVAAGVSPHLPCAALHGDMSQAEREKVLRGFRRGTLTTLVATDVAARGLDIPDVDLVVHYEPPRDGEAFLHRSGRTGRAGRDGMTIVMYTRRELPTLRRVLAETRTAGMTHVPPPSAVQVMEAAARRVMSRLDGVQPEVRAFFTPVARRVLASHDPQAALEAALAALSGVREAPEPRSLLTQQDGLQTLRLEARRGRISGVGQLCAIMRTAAGKLGMKFVADEQEAAAAQQAGNAADTLYVGRVRMIRASSRNANDVYAAFDVPAAAVPRLLEAAPLLEAEGFALSTPESLPPEEDLYAPEPASSRYGYSRLPDRPTRGPGGGRDRGSNSSSGNRRGNWTPAGAGRGSGNWDDRRGGDNRRGRSDTRTKAWNAKPSRGRSDEF